MPLYEHTFLTRHNLTPQQATGLADRFGDVIAEGGGRLVDQEYWGLRSLAYRIRNNRKAHFCFLRTDAPIAAVREMERRMQINEDVLRVLTVRVNKHDEGATPIMRAKPSRDMRRPRRRSDDDSGGRPHRSGPRHTDAAPAGATDPNTAPVAPTDTSAPQATLDSAPSAVEPTAPTMESQPIPASDSAVPAAPTPDSGSESPPPVTPASESTPAATAIPTPPVDRDSSTPPPPTPNPATGAPAADTGEDK